VLTHTRMELVLLNYIQQSTNFNAWQHTSWCMDKVS